MVKWRGYWPRTCRPKTQMATQICFLSELCANSRCSLSIVDDDIKDTSTWHLSSKNTNGDTNMLPVRTTCRLKIFTVNSWSWNQGYIDLAPVVQKHKWLHKDASFQSQNLPKLLHHKEWWHFQYDTSKNDHNKLFCWLTNTLTLTHTHTHTHSHTHINTQRNTHKHIHNFSSIDDSLAKTGFDDNL